MNSQCIDEQECVKLSVVATYYQRMTHKQRLWSSILLLCLSLVAMYVFDQYGHYPDFSRGFILVFCMGPIIELHWVWLMVAVIGPKASWFVLAFSILSSVFFWFLYFWHPS